jgi:hypothetical protein
MKIAVMQPYFFPYIGYFQLVQAVDLFVFYDDVNFIKGGWINRNRILINNQPSYVTIPLKGASPNKLICEIEFIDSKIKFLKSIKIAYSKAPFFELVYPLIEEIFMIDSLSISDLAIKSITKISEYLGINTKFEVSSKSYWETKKTERSERLISICKKNNIQNYINPLGGSELYNKHYFLSKGISLSFLKSYISKYKQYNEDFIEGLSIIDVMMFNNPKEILKMVEAFELV